MKTTILSTVAAIISLAAAHAVEIGKPAPDFKAKNLKGEAVALADYKGKIVVLEWNNFDCPFVKKHYGSGNLPKLQETYTGKGIVWLTINSSAQGKQGFYEPAVLVGRASKEGNKATQYLADTDGAVGKAYGAKVTPHMFVIDQKGNLAYDGALDSKATPNAADIEGSENYVAKAIDALLASQPVATSKTQPYGCGVKY